MARRVPNVTLDEKSRLAVARHTLYLTARLNVAKARRSSVEGPRRLISHICVVPGLIRIIGIERLLD